MHFQGSSISTPPRRHHYNNYPPQEYTDLQPDDIKQLAPLFEVAPQPDTPAHAAHEDRVKMRSSALPSHLRCKFSMLSTFCSLHDKISPLPILSILDVVKHEVAPGNLAPKHEALGAQYFVLQELNAIWTKPAYFEAVFGRDATDLAYHGGKCAACKLARVAKDVPTLTALGGLVISSINPKNWKKSKRIQWMEEWVKASVEFSYQAPAAVKTMYDLGAALTPDPGESNKPRRNDSRAFVDEYAARALKAKSRNSGQSKRRDSRESIDEFVASPNMAIDLADKPYTGTQRQNADNPQNPFVDEHEQACTPTTAGFRSSFPESKRPSTAAATSIRTPASRASPPALSSVYAQSRVETHPPTLCEVRSSVPGIRQHSQRIASSIYPETELEEHRHSTAPSHDDVGQLPTPRAPAPLRVRAQPVASSVYSRPTNEGESSEFWTSSPSQRTESRIIDSYRYRPNGRRDLG